MANKLEENKKFDIDELLKDSSIFDEIDNIEIKPKKGSSFGKTKLYAVPFFAVLIIISVISLIIPLRPTQSIEEKRNLAEFPSFSGKALLDGSYFDDITLWFSDTFPARQAWINTGKTIDRLHGNGEVSINGNFGGGDNIPDVIPTAKPKEEEKPEETPEPTPIVIETPPPTPELVETEAPEGSIEEWGGIGVGEEAEVVFGEVIQIGDTAFTYYGFSQYGADQHVKLMENCADVMAEMDINVYNILVPTSVGVMVSSEFMESVKCSDQGAAITYINESMSDDVKAVNIFNTLVEHNDEYLFFRTDHHWTALAAYYSYVEYCKAADLEPAELSDFNELILEGFRGSSYYKAPNSNQLLDDVVYAYEPKGDVTMKITADAGNTFPWTVITDMNHAAANTKYLCFIGGDNPLTVITNNDLPDDAPSCVLIKDSYGNAFAPFLSQNYKNVYILDYRKYFDMKLRYFVQLYDVDDVIVMESLALAQSEGGYNLVGSLTK